MAIYQGIGLGNSVILTATGTFTITFDGKRPVALPAGVFQFRCDDTWQWFEIDDDTDVQVSYSPTFFFF